MSCFSGGFKGGGGAATPYLLIFFKKLLFPCISLCAFAINEDGADKLYSAPFKIFGSATKLFRLCWLGISSITYFHTYLLVKICTIR